MIPSWFDALLVFILIGSTGFGFHEGLLRQAFLLLAIYIGTVLSAQYYGQLSSLLLRTFPSSSTQVTDMVAFVIILSAITIVVTWLIWSGYHQTRLPTAMIVDNIGGATLGAIFGLFAIAITIMIANYALQAPWPDGSSVKYALRIGVGNSSLQEIFSAPMPIFRTALAPWLPANIPFTL